MAAHRHDDGAGGQGGDRGADEGVRRRVVAQWTRVTAQEEHQQGRLHVKWQHAIDAEQDAGELIRLDLTARGPVKTSDDLESSVLNGIDLGHETIVRSFRVLMSDAANQEWKLKNVSSS